MKNYLVKLWITKSEEPKKYWWTLEVSKVDVEIFKSALKRILKEKLFSSSQKTAAKETVKSWYA